MERWAQSGTVGCGGGLGEVVSPLIGNISTYRQTGTYTVIEEGKTGREGNKVNICLGGYNICNGSIGGLS